VVLIPVSLLSTDIETDTMKIDRRRLLLAAAAVATATTSSAHGDQGMRVSQEELDDAIRLHGMWLKDSHTGQRCMFGGRNLAGLHFGALGGPPVDLNGADFAQANLTETEADDILLHHCSFNGAVFDGCQWRQPVFAFADMRRASAKAVKWGNPGRRRSPARLLADFRHTVLNDANLTEAQICGYFYGTKLVSVNLERANFSHSDFLGPKHHEMTFSGAQLSGAKLRYCRMSSVSFFQANCSKTDFSRAILSDVRMKGCNLTDACFRGAIIERTLFSVGQIGQADLQRYLS
jgi:uncharacterized protein YjbI with pentapeptide repeats